MEPKFYFTSLAARPLTLSGHVFRFAVYSLAGGRAAGVFKATTPQEIAILDDAVRSRRGVSVMTPEDGASALGKASQTPQRVSSTGYKPRVIQPPILPPLAVEEKAGVPSADGTKPAVDKTGLFSGPGGRPMSEAEKNRPSIGNLLKIGKVNPPKPFAASEAKIRKASARADRAKIRIVRPAE